MKRLTLTAVALAAGMATFGASAKEAHRSMSREELIAAFDAKKKSDAEKKKNIDETTTASITTGKKSGGTSAKKTRTSASKARSSKGSGTKQASGQGGTSYSTLISQYASSYGVPVALAHAVVRVESNFRPDARGRAGEIGLMQIKPTTARAMGYSGSISGLYNPETNIKYGMKYLAKAHELGGGSTCGTILKYNAGHGAKRMNKISAAYCAKVKRHMGS